MPSARAVPLALLLLAGTAAAEPSPAEVYSVSPLLDGAVITASALLTVTPVALEDRIIRLRCPCDRSGVPRFDRFVIGSRSGAAARASDVTLWLAVAAPLFLDLADLGPGDAWMQDAIVFGQAVALSSAAMTAMKYLVQRPTPRAYAGDAEALRDRGAYRGFYSGHTTLVFTSLTTAAWTIRFRYGERIWPWLVTGVAGSSVAVERVLAGRHFPSDVLAGGAMGLAIGTLVPHLHRRSRPGGSGVSVLPGARGLLLSGTF